MKKKIMASLLVGSAVVGASLAPLFSTGGDDREYACAG